MLPGDKPEPGGEIAPSFEDIHRRREGLDRQGRDWADARHRLQTPGRFAACRFLSRHLLKSGDGFRQPFDLIQKDTRQFHDEKRKRCRLILDRIFENFHIRRPLRGHDAVLRQMTAEGIYQLRALPDQKIPRPEQHGARLLFLGLNRDKAHRRSTCRLSDRFGVGRIVLLTLDERFDVSGWDQSNLMPEVTDGPHPVVRAPTGFHGDAARLLGKEAKNFLSGKLFTELWRSTARPSGAPAVAATITARCLWSAPGPVIRDWCSVNARSTASRTRSPLPLSCSIPCISTAPRNARCDGVPEGHCRAD